MKQSRMGLCVGAVGVLLSAMLSVGLELQSNGRFASAAWLWRLAWLAPVCALAVWALYALMDKPRAGKPCGWFGRLTGSPVFVFVLILACWLPTWLAYWPGTLSADPLTQFDSYYNEDPSAHHPLLHTALLGACMMLGIDTHPEGFATNGLALYFAIQLTVLAGLFAYAFHWLKKRGAPVWCRALALLLIAAMPFYAINALSAQKDVLFAGLVMAFCLQLADLWRYGLKPLRCLGFALTAVLMMLLRNNGVYALYLLIPFAIWWAGRGQKLRTGALLAGCAAVYLMVNGGVIALLDAEKADRVEMLSIPLQQMGRTLREHPEAIVLDEDGYLDELFAGENPADIYSEVISDPLKWAADYDMLEEDLGAFLRLWARMGLRYPGLYFEAGFVQNLPYFMPYSPMLYYFDTNIEQPEWFPIEQTVHLPAWRSLMDEYDETLVFAGLPGTRLLSDTAVWVWLALIGLGYAVYRRRRGLMAAFGFLLAVWITCLLGPVAIIRYMLSFFYTVPILLCALLAPEEEPC